VIARLPTADKNASEEIRFILLAQGKKKDGRTDPSIRPHCRYGANGTKNGKKLNKEVSL